MSEGPVVEKKLSLGLSMAWQMAAHETVAANCMYIEKEQVLIGICSLEKPVLLIQEQGGSNLPILKALQKEQKDIDDLLSNFGLEATQFRRDLRKMVGRGESRTTEDVIHRSVDCKKVFERAGELASSSEVSVLHFVAAVMENPGITIDTLLQQNSVKASNVAKQALLKATKTDSLPSTVITPKEESKNKSDKIQQPNNGTSETAHVSENSPPPELEKKIKNKIFIVHGRDDSAALALKDYLREKKLNAVVFDDLKLNAFNKTIIEILEEIRDEAAYAFIIATPDDLGQLASDAKERKDNLLIGRAKVETKDIQTFFSSFNTRARQNVVFEYGLFMGAIGRDRTCCLLKIGVKEKPSDLDGLLSIEYTHKVSERFSEIEAKLKDPKIGLLKSS